MREEVNVTVVGATSPELPLSSEESERLAVSEVLANDPDTFAVGVPAGFSRDPDNFVESEGGSAVLEALSPEGAIRTIYQATPMLGNTKSLQPSPKMGDVNTFPEISCISKRYSLSREVSGTFLRQRKPEREKKPNDSRTS
jgi:hypothetical protein